MDDLDKTRFREALWALFMLYPQSRFASRADEDFRERARAYWALLRELPWEAVYQAILAAPSQSSQFIPTGPLLAEIARAKNQLLRPQLSAPHEVEFVPNQDHWDEGRNRARDVIKQLELGMRMPNCGPK